MFIKYPRRKVLSESLINHLSKPLTRILLKTNLSPNLITLIGGIFAFIGINLLFVSKLLSSLFLLLYLIFDFVDGDIARNKKIFTKLGWWGDKIIDKSVQTFLILSLYIFFRGNSLV